MDTKKILAELKKIDFSEAGTLTLFVLFRSRDSTYTAKFVETNKRLKDRLLGFLKRKIEGTNHLEPYAPETTELDTGSGLIEEKNGTEFGAILAQLQEGIDVAAVKEANELNGAHSYVIQWAPPRADRRGDDPPGTRYVYGVRRIPLSWKPKKLGWFDWVAFQNRVLVDLENTPSFRLDGTIDYVAYREHLVILNKREFENHLNLRKGMTKSRDAFFADPKVVELFVDIDKLKAMCGDQLRYMRKLASIHKSGHYKNPQFLNRVLQVAKKKKQWKAIFVEGKIQISETNLDDILSILGDNRLSSPFTDTDWDVVVKKPA